MTHTAVTSINQSINHLFIFYCSPHVSIKLHQLKISCFSVSGRTDRQTHKHTDRQTHRREENNLLGTSELAQTQ